MKRLLACLLAMMLPCCALADTYAMTVTAQVSPEGLSELLQLGSAALFMESAPFSEKGVASLATFLSGFSTIIQADDAGAFDMSLSYDGQQIMDFQSAVSGGKEAVVSSLFPGLLLTSPADSEQSEIWARAEAALAEMDWDDLFTTIDWCFSGWEQTLDITTEYGYFAGDAYAREGRCITLRFDERDVGVLLEALARAAWPDGINELTRAISLSIWDDENALRDAVLGRVHTSAFQNRYAYVLRLVDGDDDDAPLGLSLLTYEDGQLVSTLSMGFRSRRIDAVLGYGLRGENVYLSTTLLLGASAGEPVCYAQLWSDPEQEGYYAVSSDPQEANLQLTVAAYHAEDSASESVKLQFWGPALWNALVEVNMVASEANELITAVTLNDKPLLDVSLYAFVMPENLPALETEGLQEVPIANLSPEDELLMAESFEEGIGTLLMTMGFVIPPDLMTTLLPELLF